MSLCRMGPRGLPLKRGSVLHLQIALHNHFLLPTRSSQAALCAKVEKSANRGVQSAQGPSTGPYSSSSLCSSLLLPDQPSGWLYFKKSQIFPSQSRSHRLDARSLVSLVLNRRAVSEELPAQPGRRNVLVSVCVCVSATPLSSVLLRKKGNRGVRGQR